MSKANVVLLDAEMCQVVMKALGKLPAEESMNTILNLQQQFSKEGQDRNLKVVAESKPAQEHMASLEVPESVGHNA